MRLKELRLSKGVTQKEVADSICCSSNDYARYERQERERSGTNCGRVRYGVHQGDRKA